MKKGFTLLELMTVIIILGVLGLIVFPVVSSVIRDSNEKLYEEQLNKIKTAASKWAYENINLLPNTNGESVTITLLELKKGGYLPLDIKDPRNDELIPNGLSIVITYNNNSYDYVINEVISNSTYNANGPSLVLNGNPLETIEMGYPYNEKGVVAKTVYGNPINNVDISYYLNGSEVDRIDVNKLLTYTVSYSVTDEGITNTVTRTVIVRDTEKPSITLPSKVTISQSDAENYDLYENVVITDNSNEQLSISITGFDTTVGEKIVSYKACDSSNNCDTKNRIIVVQ